MEVLVGRIAPIVLNIESAIAALQQFAKSPIFGRVSRSTGSPCVCDASGDGPNDQVDEMMKRLQELNHQCHKSLDLWDFALRGIFGIGSLAPLEKAITEARTAISEERQKRSNYFAKRAEYQLKISRFPNDTEDYRKALSALEDDTILEIASGTGRIVRCLQTISLILQEIIKVLQNPPASPKPKPPPPGMYV